MQPSLRLLGVPRLRRGGAWMDLPLRQSLLLGAYLAHRDDWVGRDELLALFWPDEAE